MNQPAATPELIDLDRPETWPTSLSNFLASHHQLFLNWEISGSTCVSPQYYDRAICALGNILAGYAIRGWHCTRLTEAEIEAILASGMQLPDENMLSRRIDALVLAGVFTPAAAMVLKAKNQAHEKSRTGRVWFCFFEPSGANEGGIGDFFRYWGGEALYNSHDSDPSMTVVIGRIGTPCLIEADVPIALFGSTTGLPFKVVRRFLISRGYETVEPVEHEDRIVRPLSANAIRRIIRYPTTEFRQLTGCDAWERPISEPSK